MESGIVGVDIGASNIKCALGLYDREHDRIDIIAVTTVPSMGIQDGTITHRDKLLLAIKEGIRRVKEYAQCEVHQIIISISSRHFYTLDAGSTVSISAGRVTHQDVLKAVTACHEDAPQAQVSQGGYGITHTLPQQYLLDHQPTQLAPWSQPALHLGIKAHLVYGHRETLNQIWHLQDSLRAPLIDVTCDLLAQSEGILPQDAPPTSLALLDIGSETTKVLLIKEGKPIFFFCRLQGGVHITHEIQRQFKIADFDEAEHIKINFGRVYVDVHERHEERIPIYGEGPIRYVRQESLSRILERTITENLSALRVRLEEAGVAALLSGGVHLTGGTANIQGICELASDILQTKVQIGSPQQKGVHDLVRKPQFATVNGLVIAGFLERHNHWFSSWKREINEIPPPNHKYKYNRSKLLQDILAFARITG
jgi:cell division protein FtsA